MARSRRARRESARRRAGDRSHPLASAPAPQAPSAEPRAVRKVLRSRPARAWYRDPRFQQIGFLLVSATVVAGLVYLFNAQQLMISEPTPTWTLFPTSTPNATATAEAAVTATARADATALAGVPPEAAASPTATATPSPTVRPRPTYTAAPALTIDPTRAYTATLETNRGPIVIQLLPQDAPLSVNNFVFLAREGFYDGLTFHRVEDWLIQGGDPLGTGFGGPGYRFPDEPVKGEYLRGTVAMANAGPNTNGSQFFILKRDTPQLPKQYNLFGRVVQGMDVVDQIQRGDRIERVTITSS
ncbi:MAG: hypothetical protein KatS3mg061_2525 [Dehalococcoidia bacterium]|nr:MAG: hypothetical protein KatS3mg061_2525 [Dehalococcoidia bacterium]